MNRSDTPVLARNDPDQAPLTGNVKVTRADWLNLARNVLVTDGVGELKILPLAGRMGVSRSSFYWYFENRADLLAALLDEWEARNTQSIVSQCARPSTSITEGVCNFFRCFVDSGSFDQGLDFAVREWARRDSSVRLRIDQADIARIRALTELFSRHGFCDYDADARARIVYFMQLGYHALELRESMPERMGRLIGFLRGFTGEEPDENAVKSFKAFALAQEDIS